MSHKTSASHKYHQGAATAVATVRDPKAPEFTEEVDLSYSLYRMRVLPFPGALVRRFEVLEVGCHSQPRADIWVHVDNRLEK